MILYQRVNRNARPSDKWMKSIDYSFALDIQPDTATRLIYENISST